MLKHESADSVIKKTHNDLDTIRIYYALILEKCYGIKTEFDNHKIIRLENAAGHNIRFYKIKTDTQFIAVNPNGKLPLINEDWANMLCGSEKNFIKLTEQFPASLFTVEGFTIFYAQDITADEAMNQLKNIVLNLHDKQEENPLNEIEHVLGILLGNTSVKMGVAPFFKVKGEIVTDTSYYEKTILISTLDQCPNDKINPKTAAEKFLETPGAIVFPEVNVKTIAEHPILKGLKYLHIGSYMVMPVRGSGGFILGALELATEAENVITKNLLPRLEPALNLIADLLEFMISQFEEKIRTVIKERFTPLQPSVEWKFNEAAWQFIRSRSQEESQLPNVVFEDVFPLYGAVDVRNSSVERNKAAQKDMISQLQNTHKLLTKICPAADDKTLEELYCKNSTHLQDIEVQYSAENEQKIHDFFVLELYPVLKEIASQKKIFSVEIDSYLDKTNLKKGDFHSNGRTYEQSLQKINKTINRFLESERIKQQKIYPHYFEKYRTDGVEYTLYIGQSFDPKKTFKLSYLKNLHTWQLGSMAHIGYLTKKVAAEMAIPLQTTQLILAHNLPITISFRKDERRFDVEGSYNIRYEVMKKRIDKIEVLDTGERLTKPGHVAVVYIHASEAEEYRHQLDILISRNVFEANYEELELEDMQGVSGLKAFRAAINYAHFEHKKTLKPETESHVG